MFRKTISVILCGLLMLSMLPTAVFGADSTYALPIRDEMESTNGILGLDPANVFLVQDRVSGNYAVKTTYGDIPSLNYARYTLAASDNFDIKKYSQIKLWVKPGPGASWIKFYTNNNIIASDKDGDGTFKVGEDLISGKWNAVTLDLSKLAINDGKDLVVDTNEYSSWTFDEVKSVYASTSTVDISKMVNGQTQQINGGVQFKPNGTTGFNINPTILVSQNNSSASAASFTRNSTAYQENSSQVGQNIPRYKAGKFGSGIWLEEGTSNLFDQTKLSTFWAFPSNTRAVQQSNGFWRIPRGSDSEFLCDTAVPIVNGNTYTESFYFYHDGTISFHITFFTNNGHHIIPATIVDLGGGLKRAYATYKTVAGDDLIRTIDINGVSGTFTYLEIGKVQMEQKDYVTSFHDSIRNTEQLNYNLSQTLPGEFFTSGWFRPDFSSSALRTNGSYFISLFNDPNNRFGIRYRNDGTTTIRKVGFFKQIDGNLIDNLWSDSLTFSQKDNIFWAAANLTVSHGELPAGMHLWIGVNGSNLQHYYYNNVSTVSNIKQAYVGTYVTPGYEANGTIDAAQIMDVNSFEASGTTFNSAFVNSQYTASSAPKSSSEHLLLCNYDNSIETLGSFSNDTQTLPAGKISNINIDSGYVDTAGNAVTLSNNRLYLSGTQAKVLAMSGDGNKVYYSNLNDGEKLYLLNLLTGENKKVSDYIPIKIKVNEDGKKAVFSRLYNGSSYLYVYDEATAAVTSIYTASGGDAIVSFDIQNNGTIYYLTKTSPYSISKYINGSTSNVWFGNDYNISKLAVPKTGDRIFCVMEKSGDYRQLYSLTNTSGLWEPYSLRTTALDIMSNADGSLIYFPGSKEVFQVSTKAARKIEVKGTALGFVGTDKIVSQLAIGSSSNPPYLYKLYDINTDTETDIKPGDARNPNTDYETGIADVIFSVNQSGSKMAYVSFNGTSTGLSTCYINGVQRPERYLFSFDGKNSWHTYKDGVWRVVKSGGAPGESELAANGMTIDEVNGLTPADFEGLYADGREITQFDAAVYFASTDPFISPALKGIRVTLNGGQADGEIVLERYLYTTKEQSFHSEKWRKIKKIYPVEMFPREADSRYFILADSVYKSYKNNAWTEVETGLLDDVENNWISITQQGMTGDELKKISETSFEDILGTDEMKVVYALRVEDLSTEAYSSLIAIDYVESMFDASTMTLKINFMDGTAKNYENMDKDDVENFMEWMSGRQFNNGPIFYTIKTVSGGVEVNDFISYYTIKSVSVDDSAPEA